MNANALVLSYIQCTYFTSSPHLTSPHRCVSHSLFLAMPCNDLRTPATAPAPSRRRRREATATAPTPPLFSPLPPPQ